MTPSELPPGTGGVLEIDLSAIVANWRRLSVLHPSGPVAGVVKADAYGLGATQVASALRAAGCNHFFVATLDEALVIRPLLPGTMIGVLNGLIAGSEDAFIAHDMTPVLGSLAEIDRWCAAGRQLGRRLPAILHVDTGMARLGLDAVELGRLSDDPVRMDGIALLYVMTHLVSSELREDPLNADQLARFEAACARLPPARRSLANSSGIFLGPWFGSDLARPGAALYGINPTPGASNPMRLTVRLRVRVLQVRQIEAGASVGYNATWRAARLSRIATAALGYADGWHRSLSGRGHAVFDGCAVPLVGRVSMDLSTFDVTEHPALGVGNWLEVIGPGCPPDDVAIAAGTNAYEVLTALGRRFHRVYLTS
jgi:alanine racemase